MNPLIETVVVVALAALGFLAGHMFSRLRKPYWLIGYVPPLALILTVAMPKWVYALIFVAPFSWVTAGRREFVVFSVACTMLFGTILPGAPTRRIRNLLIAFMVVAVVSFGVLPFLMPAICRSTLAGIDTYTTEDGICLQQTSYTCGAAAAVTALARFGVQAGEGELAILSHTNRLAGTPPDSLCMALQERYGPKGLSFEYRRFRSISDLRGAIPTIAVIDYTALVDHYVTVLEVTEDSVVVGDPLKGKRSLTHEEFRGIWHFCGITVERTQVRD